MKKKIAGLCLGLILVFASLNSVEAASGWQNIGTWTMSNVIVFESTDGGDVKACVPGTAKETFGLGKNKAIDPNIVSKKTSGVKGDNCAVWRDAVTKGVTYRLWLESGGTVVVTVYD